MPQCADLVCVYNVALLHVCGSSDIYLLSCLQLQHGCWSVPWSAAKSINMLPHGHANHHYSRFQKLGRLWVTLMKRYCR